MKCPYCDKEFTSEKIYYSHLRECKKNINVGMHKGGKKGATRKELFELAREKGIKGYNKIKNEELIELLGDVGHD